MSLNASHTVSNFRGKGLLALWGCIDPATTNETDLNDWWTNEHLPERLRLPGFERARRYRAVEHDNGNKEYMALYEVLNVEDLASVEYLHALNNPTPRTKQFMPCLAGMNRSACRTLSSKQPPVASSKGSDQEHKYLILMVLHALRSSAEIGNDLETIVIESLCRKEHPTPIEVRYTHIAEQDEWVTRVGSTSKSYDGVQFTQQNGNDKNHGKLILLFDLGAPDAPKSWMTDVLHSEWLNVLVRSIKNTGIEIGYRNLFELICSVDKCDIDGLAE